ncbi:tyrosine-type recombinase/integrase [Nakamurella sp. GG22]
MARPTLPPGEMGEIATLFRPDNTDAVRWRARGRMRLIDHSRTDPRTGAYLPGRRVDITGHGPTEKEAVAACRKAAQARLIAERAKANTTQRAVTEARKVDAVAETLLRAAERSGELAPSSLASYRVALGHLRTTELADMGISDVRPTDVATALALIAAAAAVNGRAAKGGTGAAKTARALLNRVFGHAVTVGWLDSSPVRDAGAIRTPKGRGGTDRSQVVEQRLDHDRALTRAEKVALAWSVARSERAVRLDVRDLVLAGMAIGGRIGEVCAIRWADVSIHRTRDSDGRLTLTGSVTLAATVDREAGRGIVRHEPKTAASVRTVPVPRRVVALLARRAVAGGVVDMTTDERPVFANPGRWGMGSGWRDRSNTAAALRAEFDAAGFTWLSYHGLRRAAVTALADHLPIRAVADYAGHKSIRTTLDNYIGRSAVSGDVALYV